MAGENNRIELGDTSFALDCLSAIEEMRHAQTHLQKVYGRMTEYGTLDAGIAALAAYLGLSGEDASAKATTVRSDFQNAINQLGMDFTYLYNRVGR